MNKAASAYVLDTSAWLTLIEDEAGADAVQDILEKAQAGETIVLVSSMSFMEVYYITLQERDVNEARERVNLMAALPILRVESTRTLGVLAAELKATHRLSVADAWIAALAEVSPHRTDTGLQRIGERPRHRGPHNHHPCIHPLSTG